MAGAWVVHSFVLFLVFFLVVCGCLGGFFLQTSLDAAESSAPSRRRRRRRRRRLFWRRRRRATPPTDVDDSRFFGAGTHLAVWWLEWFCVRNALVSGQAQQKKRSKKGRQSCDKRGLLAKLATKTKRSNFWETEKEKQNKKKERERGRRSGWWWWWWWYLLTGTVCADYARTAVACHLSRNVRRPSFTPCQECVRG